MIPYLSANIAHPWCSVYPLRVCSCSELLLAVNLENYRKSSIFYIVGFYWNSVKCPYIYASFMAYFWQPYDWRNDAAEIFKICRKCWFLLNLIPWLKGTVIQSRCWKRLKFWHKSCLLQIHTFMNPSSEFWRIFLTLLDSAPFWYFCLKPCSSEENFLPVVFFENYLVLAA